MESFPSVLDWKMPAYVLFETATQPLNGVATFYSWVQFRNQSPSVLLPCPYDLLDTVYPPAVIDFWLSAFLQEARVDNGGHLDNLSLRNALGDIQSHILKTYGAQAISVYDLPNTAKAWKTLVLLQPPPMLQPWPKDFPTTNGLPVTHSGLPVPDSLPGSNSGHYQPPSRQFSEIRNMPGPTASQATGTSSTLPAAKRARFAPPLQPDDLKQLEKPPVPKKTQQATHWAIRVFNDWVTERNGIASSMFQCPQDLLSKPYPTAILDQWLAAFIMEVRKADGSYYTPDSLQCILAGIQH